MNLEDIMIDYIAVFPDGNLNYLKFFIKQKSYSDLINFIRTLDNDLRHNKAFYNSIYMQKFLIVIKNEYDERVQSHNKEVSNKKLSCNAEEFVPLNPKST